MISAANCSLRLTVIVPALWELVFDVFLKNLHAALDLQVGGAAISRTTNNKQQTNEQQTTNKQTTDNKQTSKQHTTKAQSFKYDIGAEILLPQ